MVSSNRNDQDAAAGGAGEGTDPLAGVPRRVWGLAPDEVRERAVAMASATERAQAAQQAARDEAAAARHELEQARAESRRLREELDSAHERLRYWQQREQFVDEEVARARQAARDLESEARARASELEAQAQERSLVLVDRAHTAAAEIVERAREQAMHAHAAEQLQMREAADDLRARIERLTHLHDDVRRALQSTLRTVEGSLGELERTSPARIAVRHARPGRVVDRHQLPAAPSDEPAAEPEPPLRLVVPHRKSTAPAGEPAMPTPTPVPTEQLTAHDVTRGSHADRHQVDEPYNATSGEVGPALIAAALLMGRNDHADMRDAGEAAQPSTGAAPGPAPAGEPAAGGQRAVPNDQDPDDDAAGDQPAASNVAPTADGPAAVDDRPATDELVRVRVEAGPIRAFPMLTGLERQLGTLDAVDDVYVVSLDGETAWLDVTATSASRLVEELRTIPNIERVEQAAGRRLRVTLALGHTVAG